MNQPFMIRNDALAGLGNLVNTPLARGVVRYWWVSAPLAALGYYYWKQAEKNGKQSVGQLVHDLAPALSLVSVAIMLNSTLAKEEQQAPAPLPAALRPSAPIDASFTPAPVEARVVS